MNTYSALRQHVQQAEIDTEPAVINVAGRFYFVYGVSEEKGDDGTEYEGAEITVLDTCQPAGAEPLTWSGIIDSIPNQEQKLLIGFEDGLFEPADAEELFQEGL